MARTASRCTNPAGDEGNRARYTIDGVRFCIVCDGPPLDPPLTFEAWLRGEGGEPQRQEFENDWRAVRAKTATPEQATRFAFAIGATKAGVYAMRALPVEES